MHHYVKLENEPARMPLRSRACQLAHQRFKERVSKRPRSFLSIEDLSSNEMTSIISCALDMKLRPMDYCAALRNTSVALIFQKTSTRTRCSFENAAVEMGAHPSYIDWHTTNFTLADLSDEIIVLSRYYHLVAARVLDHATLGTMAAYSEAPIINAMCNLMHPCQALADYMTITEYFGHDLDGLQIAYVGDGNNVCRSLVHCAVKLGIQMTIASPTGYTLDRETIESAMGLVKMVEDPFDAVWNADVIYTDTWISIGQESEAQTRQTAFQKYQVNEALMNEAPDHALFMHCLPAHPGYEVTPDVLRGPRSIVFDQADNRKHAQKALMKKLLS